MSRRMKKMPLLKVAEPGRICWLCEHVYFRTGEPDYSELTPGADFKLECGKDYWEFDNYEDGLEQFRAKLESAERCADFSERHKR